MGGLLRCVSCGEVHWNLRFGARSAAATECRVCGSELRDERRRLGRRFDRIRPERRDETPPRTPAGLGGSSPS